MTSMSLTVLKKSNIAQHLLSKISKLLRLKISFAYRLLSMTSVQVEHHNFQIFCFQWWSLRASGKSDPSLIMTRPIILQHCPTAHFAKHRNGKKLWSSLHRTFPVSVNFRPLHTLLYFDVCVGMCSSVLSDAFGLS